MLTEEKKKLIEAEEKFRHEIAQRLKSEAQSVEENVAQLEKSVWGKVFEILNSNFGLWLLSSVVLSGGAAIYQITSHHFTQKLIAQKDFLTCEFEIENRLNAMGYLLKKANTVAEAQYALTPMTKSFGAVSPEYDHVNIAGLYFKTYQLTGIRNRQSEENVKELEELSLGIQQADPKAKLDDQARDKLIKLIESLKDHSMKVIESGKGTLNY